MTDGEHEPLRECGVGPTREGVDRVISLGSNPTEVPAGGMLADVGIGRRVVIISNLLLDARPTSASQSAASSIAQRVSAWEGPGLVVVAGGLLYHPEGGGEAARAALDGHPDLRDALNAFAAGEDRRVVFLPGEREAGCLDDEPFLSVMGDVGVEVVSSLDLRLATAAGERRVRVQAGSPPGRLLSGEAARPADRGLEGPGDGGEEGPVGVVTYCPAAPWQEGMDRLAEPGSLQRFLTSRLLYRRVARYAWWLLLPFAVALLLQAPTVVSLADHLLVSHPGAARAVGRAVRRAHHATLGSRLAIAGTVSLLELLIMVAVLGWLSRKAWSALGGGRLGGVFDRPSSSGATGNDPARDEARRLVAVGYTGFVSGATLQAELTHLGEGFFACPGTAGEVVEEHPGRLGLPPVFLAHPQIAWVELETGADLHARLLLARSDVAPSTLLERIAARRRPVHDHHPVVVASYPSGTSWPPAPDLTVLRRRSRRVRRWSGGAIAVTGAVDLLAALTPPLRSHLHVVLELLPLGATQAAGALVALAGMGLLALARGVRRGQKRAWRISVGLLAATLVLHVAHGGDVVATLLTAAVLALLVVDRSEFAATSDRPSLRSATIALLTGAAGIIAGATALVEVSVRIDRDHTRVALPVIRAAEAVSERLIGLHAVSLPPRLDGFLTPTLLAIGMSLAAIALMLATRPVVDRRFTSGRAADMRARDIVKRHGEGTLDYFALRSDKQRFFHRDSLVAYAIYGGICLVSPDPIGPSTEREQVWAAFRRFADGHGWVVAIMGASAEWLPVYRSTGMHDIYIGDEAVVDIRAFSLGGGHMKGLRQAHNRIARYGYTASFHDPAHLDPATAGRLAGLMSQSRRGECERGFSMMLGRIFDPRDIGLLLCVVSAPDGSPAAMCQFVPAPGIGGYSLDLMRRDRGDHPNGLIDFALVSTIEYLRDNGYRGLSLNFAAMRAVLEGERGDGVSQRVERWALKRMSSFLQIETLWRFNAKYDPAWLPRYIVYDAAEHLMPVVVAILRAESLSDVPVIGRFLTPSPKRSGQAAATEHSGTPDSSGAQAPVPALGLEGAVTLAGIPGGNGGDGPAREHGHTGQEENG